MFFKSFKYLQTPSVTECRGSFSQCPTEVSPVDQITTVQCHHWYETLILAAFLNWYIESSQDILTQFFYFFQQFWTLKYVDENIKFGGRGVLSIYINLKDKIKFLSNITNQMQQFSVFLYLKKCQLLTLEFHSCIEFHSRMVKRFAFKFNKNQDIFLVITNLCSLYPSGQYVT